MNPEEALEKVAEAIQIRDRTHDGMFTVCWLCDAYVCIPTQQAAKVETRFGTYRNRVLDQGLTTAEWDNMLYKIARFWEAKKCQKTQ